MYDFWIGTAAKYTGLDGVSQVSPILRSVFSAGVHSPTSPETADDLITVTFQDRNQVESIEAAMTDFEAYFTQARLFTSSNLGSMVVLHAEVSAGDVWESPILDGWIEYGHPAAVGASVIDARLAGVLTIVLHIHRANYWQGAEALLTCTYQGIPSTANVLYQMAHLAAANALVIDPPDSSPDLPSPLHFEIENLNAAAIQSLVISQAVNCEPVSVSYCLDSVDATGASSTASSPGDYGNNHAVCNFTGTNEAEILTWSLNAAFCQDCKGNYFRFAFRSGLGMVYTDLQVKVRLKLHVTSAVVGETAWTTLTPNKALHILEPMRLPPFLLSNFSNSAGLDLVLVVRRSTAGSHSLNVDYLQLLPLDGWRRYEALYALPQSWKLVDNAYYRVVSALDGSGNELTTHIATGHPFYLAAGVTNSFFFAWLDTTGEAAVNSTVRVKAYLVPRRRLL